MSALSHWLLPHESNNQRAKLLHPSSLLLVIGVFLSLQIIIQTVSTRYPTILGFAAQISPSEIIRLTNVERTTRGLSPVSEDPLLSRAASKKAADMIARDYWAHVSPNGTQPWFFITESGYQYRFAGENLARDFSDPASIVRAWMNSPTHRDNLLSNRYHDIGIAVVDGQLTGHDTTLIVQMFGTKLASAPQVTAGTADFAVQAAEDTVQVPVEPVEQKVVTIQPSGFDIKKIVAVFILSVFLLILVVDLYLVSHHKIVRWTGKSLAHFVFLVCVVIAAITIVRGNIV